jgi:hypothetical protein
MPGFSFLLKMLNFTKNLLTLQKLLKRHAVSRLQLSDNVVNEAFQTAKMFLLRSLLSFIVKKPNLITKMHDFSFIMAMGFKPFPQRLNCRWNIQQLSSLEIYILGLKTFLQQPIMYKERYHSCSTSTTYISGRASFKE